MKKILFIVVLALSVMIFSNCENNAEWGYMLLADYDTIRSYPNGGGVFVIYNDCNSYDEGEFTLSMKADSQLNAKLTKSKISLVDPVFEVTVNPDSNCELKDYNISVTATYTRPKGVIESSTIELVVKVSDWGCNTEDAITKLSLFKDYLSSVDTNYREIFNTPAFIYSTYTNILIVEHFTFLTENYEVRLCYHVMIPPYDWSKIRIRKRNYRYPELALLSDTNGDITVIDPFEYPKLFGY